MCVPRTGEPSGPQLWEHKPQAGSPGPGLTGRSLQLTSGNYTQIKLSLRISANPALDFILKFHNVVLTSVLGRRRGGAAQDWGG